jgi:hypothetical protein
LICLRLPSILLGAEGLLGICAVPVLVGGVWCQGSVLVQMCLPGWGTVTLDIIGKEVGIGRVRIDVLTLQRDLVTWHVIGCHCRRCVSLELVDSDWLKRDSSHRFQLSKLMQCTRHKQGMACSTKSEQGRRFREFPSLEWPVKCQCQFRM